jgi:thermostable 8-oxoguanine DNA glycosylase
MRCHAEPPASIAFVNRNGKLEEEIGFCLLGGYGIRMEIAAAYFRRLKSHGVFEQTATENEILQLLMMPVCLDGHQARYRFPRQRAHRLYSAIHDLASMELNTSDAVTLRNQLQSLEGVGPKTASWIVRNWLGADSVAILDIHVLRAGWTMGLFERARRLPQHYPELEQRFILFAERLQLRASVLDAVMWTDMRKFGSRLFRTLSMNT